MPEGLKLLMVEDSEDDAEIIRMELERGGYVLDWTRVETEESFAQALEKSWDLVICDFQMPQFNGLRAFALFKEYGSDTPFIFVSGALGEDRAVEAMRAGAKDYILKGNLARLNVAVSRELTEARNRAAQRKAEEAARQEQRRLAMAVEASGAGVFEYRVPLGSDMYVNSRWAAILGYTPQELPKYASFVEWVDEQIHPEDFPGCKKIYDDFSHGRIERYAMEVRIKHKNGAWVDVGIFAKAVERDEGDRATHIVGVMLDLSDRRILEAQLRQAQKMEAIGRLAGGVAHDLNNLLTAIFSFTDFVMDDMRPEDPAYKDLKEVEKAAKRAESLTRQLLAFSRKQISDPKSIQINTLVAEMDRMLRRILGEDIEFLTYFDEDLWNTKIDPGHLEQVIVNLAVNARDAMPTGGKITIETANVSLDETYALSHGASIPKGDYVMFAFSDSGEGMSLDVQRSIFEPFFTTKPVGKGTGLGLSTCYGIVKQARGYIWVYSELKKGTTFKVYLPRFDGDAASLEDSGRASTTHGTETILLAEDDEQVRALIVRTLARKGYKVIVAENGREASILAEKHKETIHLLITDVVMPGMSGRDLAERVSQIHQETRVLYISGYTQNAIVHHGVLEEGLILLQKPFTPDILASMVRRMLDTPNDCLVDGRRRILCVDDDARVLSAMQRSLKDDYEYVGANSGQAALELLRSSNFDLILCDINMPEMSGPQLHELVKQNNPEVASRFVFVTSAVGSEFVDSFMTQTPQPVLEKPLSSGQIKSLIAPQV